MYRRSNDSFDQNTPYKHTIVNVYIGCNAAIVVCKHYIFERTRVHFPNHLVDNNANELTKFGKSLSHFNLENRKNNSVPNDVIYRDTDWVNTGSDNGLLPDGTKALPEPKLTIHQQGPITLISGKFHI